MASLSFTSETSKATVIITYGLLLFLLTLTDTVYSAGLRAFNKGMDGRGGIKIHYTSALNDYEPLETIVDTAFLAGITEQAQSCSSSEHSNTICFKWGPNNTFSSSPTSEDDKCHIVEYTTAMKVPLKVTFNIAGLHLYGGAEQTEQLWPVEKKSFKDYAFVSKELDSQAVLESYWLNSKGSYIYVDRTVPLFISLNKEENTFSIIAHDKDPYIRKNHPVTLRYTVCSLANPRLAQEHAVRKFLGKPSGLPDTRMVTELIWSTWAKYKAAINQTTVGEFVGNILANGFPAGQISIDDSWETCYGSLTVNEDKFPDMKGMLDDLKKRGFRATLWTHPFINVNCEPYHSEAERLGYLVKNTDGNTTSVWWNGVASYIDFTNPDAASWYYNRLKNLQTKIGIDAYKFDAGESSWSPQLPVLNRMETDHPETIMKEYIKTVSQFGGLVEVRSARGTQNYPIFVRMIDRESNWSFRLGMPSLITTTLLMNILGYPFVLPDMIGGNLYYKEGLDDDFFVRWLQANVFMPSMQFSLLPWEVSSNTLQLTKKMLDLRNRYTGKIVDTMKTAVETGAPVNPPIWWVDPTDPVALEIDDEFLLGEDILIAPVLKAHSTSRDVYLPSGKWRDECKPDHPIIEGRTWLRNYPADLETLPHFTKVSSAASNTIMSVASLTLLSVICVSILNIRL